MSNFLEKIEINKLAPSKFSIDLLSDYIAEQINTGHINPLEAAVYLSAIGDVAKQVKEKISEVVLDELNKHPKGKAEIFGSAISEYNSVKYDYSHIEEWRRLDEQIKELEGKRKAIEEKEKTFYKGDLPVKSATVTYKIQLSKN